MAPTICRRSSSSPWIDAPWVSRNCDRSRPSPHPRSSTRLPKGICAMIVSSVSFSSGSDMQYTPSRRLDIGRWFSCCKIRLLQKRRQQLFERLDFEQERVVPVGAGQFNERNVPPGGDERIDELATLDGRKQPIGGVRGDEKSGLGARQGPLDRTVAFGEIKIIHGARQVQVAVSVEPLDKPRA